MNQRKATFIILVLVVLAIFESYLLLFTLPDIIENLNNNNNEAPTEKTEKTIGMEKTRPGARTSKYTSGYPDEWINGTFQSLGGETLNKWYSSLPVKRYSDPEIREYLRNLTDIITWYARNVSEYYKANNFDPEDYEYIDKYLTTIHQPHYILGDEVFFVKYGGAQRILPDHPDTPIKVYSLRTWYGVRIDYLMYIDGNAEPRWTISTYPTRYQGPVLRVLAVATIEDLDKFLNASIWMMLNDGIGKYDSGIYTVYKPSRDANIYRYIGLYMSDLGDYITQPHDSPIHAELPELGTRWSIIADVVSSMGTPFANGAPYITPTGSMLPVEYTIIMEYPVTYPELNFIELTWWILVGQPVYTLMANMMAPQANDPVDAYLKYSLFVTGYMRASMQGTYEKHNIYMYRAYPVTFLMVGKHGVCADYALARAMIANLVFKLPAVYAESNLPKSPVGHAISGIIVPSTLNITDDKMMGISMILQDISRPTWSDYYHAKKMPIDIDGDGKGEWLILLADTANLTQEETDYMFLTAGGFVTMINQGGYWFSIPRFFYMPVLAPVASSGFGKYYENLWEPFTTHVVDIANSRFENKSYWVYRGLKKLVDKPVPLLEDYMKLEEYTRYLHTVYDAVKEMKLEDQLYFSTPIRLWEDEYTNASKVYWALKITRFNSTIFHEEDWVEDIATVYANQYILPYRVAHGVAYSMLYDLYNMHPRTKLFNTTLAPPVDPVQVPNELDYTKLYPELWDAEPRVIYIADITIREYKRMMTRG